MTKLLDKSELINRGYTTEDEFKLSNKTGSMSATSAFFTNNRQDHGLFISRLGSPDYHILLSSIEETIIQNNKKFNVGAHRMQYSYNLSGMKYLSFSEKGVFPSVTYNTGLFELKKEILLSENDNQLFIKYSLLNSVNPVILILKPYLAFRNIKSLSKASSDLTIPCASAPNGFRSKLYPGYPFLFFQASIKPDIIEEPGWYFNFEYQTRDNQEASREDLYVPCSLKISLGIDKSVVISVALKEQNTETLNLIYEKEKIKLLSKACMKAYYE